MIDTNNNALIFLYSFDDTFHTEKRSLCYSDPIAYQRKIIFTIQVCYILFMVFGSLDEIIHLIGRYCNHLWGRIFSHNTFMCYISQCRQQHIAGFQFGNGIHGRVNENKIVNGGHQLFMTLPLLFHHLISHRNVILENLLPICKVLNINAPQKQKQPKETNWKQKFQKPQNENICLTYLNMENKRNFHFLSFCCALLRL